MKAVLRVVLADGFVVPFPHPSGVEDLDLPSGTFLTHVTDKSRRDRDVVEIRLPGTPGSGPPDEMATPEQLKELLRRNLVREDSSSGWDPDLHYVYDHYEVL